jgi:hypothetical protein
VREFKDLLVEKTTKPVAGMVDMFESLSDVSLNGKIGSWERM